MALLIRYSHASTKPRTCVEAQPVGISLLAAVDISDGVRAFTAATSSETYLACRSGRIGRQGELHGDLRHVVVIDARIDLVAFLASNRQECSNSGVHPVVQAGIYGNRASGAYSIVLSGVYDDDVDEGHRMFVLLCRAKLQLLIRCVYLLAFTPALGDRKQDQRERYVKLYLLSEQVELHSASSGTRGGKYVTSPSTIIEMLLWW